MNKDYYPSTKYTKEELFRLGITYSLQDSCVDELADYLTCRRYDSGALDSKFYYSIPGFTSLTQCGSLFKVWNRCQDKRERDIFEQLNKIYKENYKQSEAARAAQETSKPTQK